MVAKRKEYEQKLTEATTEEEKKLYEDLAEAAREKERETLE
jgi:Skp family chaperone for outer membrane proteins